MRYFYTEPEDIVDGRRYSASQTIPMCYCGRILADGTFEFKQKWDDCDEREMYGGDRAMGMAFCRLGVQ